MQPFKTGAGLLWKELGSAPLPVYIDGLGEIKARKERWFRSGKISVSTGKALMLDKGHMGQPTPEELTERLRRAVLELHAKP